MSVRLAMLEPVMRAFDDLVTEADAVDVSGWDFSWLDGRATEQRPSWGYQRRLGDRLAAVDAALDIQTGGGEVLAGATALIVHSRYVRDRALAAGYERPVFVVPLPGWPLPRIEPAALVGEPAVALARVDADGGRVKIGGEEWTARSYTEDEVIEPGKRVVVVEIRGATALVTR